MDCAITGQVTEDATKLVNRSKKLAAHADWTVSKNATPCFALRGSYAKLALVVFTVNCMVAPPQSIKAQAPAGELNESLDLVTISRIRDEGLNRSHAMEYASELTDGIGSRLTGSPEF